ncbi:MAG: serine acetyltransferase [Oscillospiraceae bacterium]|nr:serine acetyltransferase [Oscillospiraceae bacterium]
MHKLENNINDLMKDLLNDYDKGRTIDEVKTFDHPDKEVITEILASLRRIIFPGYFRNRSFRVYTVRNNLSMLAEDVIFKLIKQISIVLRYDKELENADEMTLAEIAEEKTFEFMGKIPKIREYIETDVQAAYDGDPAAYNKDEIIYSYPGLFAILVNRIAHELWLLRIPIIPRIMTEYAHSETGIDIHPGATIGKYFFIDHGTGIVVGETTVIGDSVKIYQGVTLGALSTRGGQALKSKKRHPTIEDNVTIYSGASILGGDTVIGKNVVIGGNAFITRSVPEGAKVSVKNQGLRYNYDASNPVQSEAPQTIEVDDESWFYII